MKDNFNKYKSRLTGKERESIWQDITEPRDLGGERKVQFWRGLGIISTSVAVVLVMVIFWGLDGDVDRFEQLAMNSDSVQVGEVAMHEINRQIEESVADDKMVASPVGRNTESAVAASDGARRELAAATDLCDTETDIQGRPVTRDGSTAAKKLDDSMTALVMEAEPVDSLENDQLTGYGRLRGLVFNSDTGEPMAAAMVTILGVDTGCLTMDDGSFDMQLPAGTYNLVFTALGYAEVQVENINVGTHLWPHMDVAMEMNPKTPYEMETIVVEGVRKPVDVGSSSAGREDLAELNKFAVDQVHDAMALRSGINIKTAPRTGQMNGKKGQGNPPALLSVAGNIKGGAQAEADHMRSTRHRDEELRHHRGSRRCWWPPETHLPNGERYDAMFFEHYGVNPFIVTEEDALSTFACDVDNASYTMMRSYVERGSLPPEDAIRVEEFINYFDQGYEPFHGDEDFAIHFDGMPSPYGDGYHLLRVSMQAREIRDRNRKPANLVFVVDTSGSMDRENRLGLVKRALMILLDELRDGDTVGIVEYGSHGRVVLRPTSVEDRRLIERAIENLRSNGSTNVEEGLDLAYEMASRMEDDRSINRLILCSDGVANTGETRAERILRNVRYQSDRGIHLSTIGFGMGNYNDILMENLANKGDGNYYYVDDLAEAERVFRENLTGTLQTIARDAKIQVEFDPRQVLRYRLLGYENRDVADEDFRNDEVDAGEIGAGHVVTALYEIKLSDDAAGKLGKKSRRGSRRSGLATARLRYEYPRNDRDRAGDIAEIEASVDLSALSHNSDDAAPHLRLAALVAEYAEILRGSFWARGNDLANLERELREIAGELRGDPDVRELGLLLGHAARVDER